MFRNSLAEEDYNYYCVESIDIIKVETNSTVRSSTRLWNRTVQFWISEYVYKRLPIKKYR